MLRTKSHRQIHTVLANLKFREIKIQNIVGRVLNVRNEPIQDSKAMPNSGSGYWLPTGVVGKEMGSGKINTKILKK